jgi:PhoD-like phosphatase
VSGRRINRRELLIAGAGAGAAIGLRGAAFAGAARPGLDFGALGKGDGWPGWRCPGVANLRRSGGLGLLEAGSDVFPCDPRPVAFAVDRRFRDGEILATVQAAGAGAGVVLRRVSQREYYAAIYDAEAAALILVRRRPDGIEELARLPALKPAGSFELTLRASGARPTSLTASLDAGAGIPLTAEARDAAPALQRAGDPGVLATARTLFPSQGPPVLPALGNLHLLPYGVQEGQAFIGSPAGQQVIDAIRERSTAAFERIELRPAGNTKPTRPSVIAATAAPGANGALLRVASDVPARIELEVSSRADFRHSRRIAAGRTDRFDAAVAELAGMRPRGRVHWRARLRRGGLESVGPARSFRALPPAGSRARATVAIGACAAQFGPIFDHIAAHRPDAFVWQGDLNYPDTLGPLAQTVDGYAGIWRDFYANPRMRPLLERALFAAQRDDHDYGVQDANSTNLVPWGLRPWESLMEQRGYYRFTAGLAEFWVLDQRRHKSDPELPDKPAKTLLGARQRDWLLRTLAASRAPFKVICSPCTLALPANSRDGNWATGFRSERDLVLAHIRKRVRGRTLFVTGDTHWTMVYDRDGLFEARPCPLCIPTPNDITLTSPQAAEDARQKPGVAYADDNSGHVALINVSGHGTTARLDLSLLRDDGTTPYVRRFEQRLLRAQHPR